MRVYQIMLCVLMLLWALSGCGQAPAAPDAGSAPPRRAAATDADEPNAHTSTGAIDRDAKAALGKPVDAAALAELPTLETANFAFAPGELRATVGETVALRRLHNDSTAHAFDIDALHVHVSMPTGAPGLALFTPTAAGTYRFYCSIPGHEAMRGTLVVRP